MATLAIPRIESQDTPTAASKKAASMPPTPRGGPRLKSKWPTAKKVLRSSGPSATLSLQDLEIPEYCEGHVAFHSSFSDERKFAALVREIESKDEELQDALEKPRAATVTVEGPDESELSCSIGRDSFDTVTTPKAQRTPDHLSQYQEFVSLFVNLFLNSKFSYFTTGLDPRDDPSNIIQHLVSKRTCPDVVLFRRVAVNPHLVGAAMPDDDINPGYAENSVAINQLARFMDVAVLQFLSSVSDKTEIHSIVWALDYMKNLLSSLISSMNTLNSFGWYGSPHIRIRKGTIRSLHPLPPMFNTPPQVVVVGSPSRSPSISPERDFRDPVTGQRSPGQRSPTPSSSPMTSPLVSHRRSGQSGMESDPTSPEQMMSGSAFHSGADGGLGRSNSYVSEASMGMAVGMTGVSQRRQDSSSRQGILKAPFIEIMPNSPPRSPKSAPHSPSSIHNTSPIISPPTRGPARKRKLTPTPPMPYASPNLPRSGTSSMESIQEEVLMELEDEQNQLQQQTPPIQTRTSTMNSIKEEGGEEEIFRMDSVGSVVGSPPITLTAPSPHLIPEEAMTLDSIMEQISNSNPYEGNMSPGSPRHLPGGVGRGKRISSVSPPPEPKDLPSVNLELELETLVNGEGRISLLALLHAISKFPQSKAIWTEEVEEKCFSLIQMCIDIGIPPQNKEETPPPLDRALSAQERRKRFIHRNNVAFNKLEEKPWKVHSDHVIEFCMFALIRCGTGGMIGCSNDTSFCRLRQFNIPSKTKSSVQSKLIHNLRRIYLLSPTIFRQALIKFAQPSNSSCHKVFQFLHIVLQYCTHATQDIYFNNILASIVVSLLGIAVDRMVLLDITEPSIQDVSHYSNNGTLTSL